MSRKTNGPDFVIIWTANAGRSTPGNRPSRRIAAAIAGPGMTGGHDGVGLAAPDEIGGDEDRGVLLLAQGEGRMLVHLDDLRGVDDRHVRSGQAPSRRS